MGGKHVQFAGDVEGHMGSSDARFYLLDLQRCFPPECPRLAASAVLVYATEDAAIALSRIAALNGGVVVDFKCCLMWLGSVVCVFV